MINKHFLAAARNGVARAVAKPEGTWSVEHVLTDQDIYCLSADPLNPAVVYVGTQNSGVLRSSDQGATWHPAGLSGQVVKSLAVSPTQPGTLYAGTRPPALYVSYDSGTSWQELVAFRRKRAFWWFSPAEGWPFSPYVQGIALSPTDPNIILAGIELGAVLRSADGGQTWSGHRRGALRDCHSLIAHASNGEWMYEGGGTGAGAAVSRDSGQTWRQSKAGLDRHYGWAVAADPAQPDIWYVALSPGPGKAHTGGQAEAYIFRAEGNAPWKKLTGGLPQPLNHMPYALLTDPAAPGHLYAGLSNGEVWFSVDYGEMWEQRPFNLKSISTLLMLPSNNINSTYQ